MNKQLLVKLIYIVVMCRARLGIFSIGEVTIVKRNVSFLKLQILHFPPQVPGWAVVLVSLAVSANTAVLVVLAMRRRGSHTLLPTDDPK